MKKNNPEDIWKLIEKKSDSECWKWRASLSNGYGQIQIQGRHYRVHRIVYELTYGKIPDGLFVCHKCDNPSCNNPKHLFLGTHQDNSNDMIAKGRQFHLKGELNGGSKLTSYQILEIRRLYSTGNYTQKELGEMFGVSQTPISYIINNKAWKHI